MSQERLGLESGAHRDYIGGVERASGSRASRRPRDWRKPFGIRLSELLALGETLRDAASS